MKTECDFYYKCKSPKGISFYGVKIITEDSHDVDAILDQITSCNGTFIDKAEFDENIKAQMEWDIVDKETSARLIGKLISEKIDLTKVKKGEAVTI